MPGTKKARTRRAWAVAGRWFFEGPRLAAYLPWVWTPTDRVDGAFRLPEGQSSLYSAGRADAHAQGTLTLH